MEPSRALFPDESVDYGAMDTRVLTDAYAKPTIYEAYPDEYARISKIFDQFREKADKRVSFTIGMGLLSAAFLAGMITWLVATGNEIPYKIITGTPQFYFWSGTAVGAGIGMLSLGLNLPSDEMDRILKGKCGKSVS